jgi:cytoskeleton protein RodZ
MPALGERFRAAREARGLTLSDVAEQIRIRSVYLAAIEDENWSTIGAPVYIRGFLRTYGRFLGLDTEEVVAEFSGASTESIAPSAIPAQKSTYLADEPAPPRHLSPLIWIASVVAIGLIAYVFYSALTAHQRQNPTMAALPSNTPTVASGTSGEVASSEVSPAAPSSAGASPGVSASPGASGTPSAAPSGSPGDDGPNTLEVRLTSPSWVRVTVDGSVSMEGTFPAGTLRRFHGKTAVLRIGNAGGVEVLVGGKDVGALGKAGDVVERTFIL